MNCQNILEKKLSINKYLLKKISNLIKINRVLKKFIKCWLKIKKKSVLNYLKMKRSRMTLRLFRRNNLFLKKCQEMTRLKMILNLLSLLVLKLIHFHQFKMNWMIVKKQKIMIFNLQTMHLWFMIKKNRHSDLFLCKITISFRNKNL
jgi:hypothetical protein